MNLQKKHENIQLFPVSMSTQSRQASLLLQSATNLDKSKALKSIQSQLEKDEEFILKSNSQDLELASSLVQQGALSSSLIKRLDLSLPGKWESLIHGITQVDHLPDPNVSFK